MRGREIRLHAQPVRLVHEILERLSCGLVVTVRSEDVDDVVTGIAVRPRDRVPPPRRGEVETEAGPAHRAHGADDPPPIRLPRGRVGRAPPGVGFPVHLPAEDDDRVAGVPGDEPLGERPVVAVERAARAAAQQSGQRRDRDPALVRRHHRDVHDQHAALVGGLPVRPRIQDALRALDVPPLVAGQVGASDRHRRAEPALEAGHPVHSFRARTQKRPQRHMGRPSVSRPRLLPGHRRRRREAEQSHGCGENGREWTPGRRPFPPGSESPSR